MGKDTKVEWTITISPDGEVVLGHTFNGWIGCTPWSPGCNNCYARELMEFRYKRAKWKKGEPRVRTGRDNWKQPLRWNKAAQKNGVRAKVFSQSLADWLDAEVPESWLADLLHLVRVTEHLDWLLLSKRVDLWRSRLETVLKWNSENFEPLDGDTRQMIEWWLDGDPPKNVWLGVSVENQPMADFRIPHLLQIPARIHFLSVEPMIGPLDITRWAPRGQNQNRYFQCKCRHCGYIASSYHMMSVDYWGEGNELPCPRCGKEASEGHESIDDARLDWVIAGGESGRGDRIRPLHPDNPRALRDQCVAAGIPFFFKQWGAFLPDSQRDFRLEASSKYDWGLVNRSGNFRLVLQDGKRLPDADGSWHDGEHGVVRLGKGAAGRMLDNVEWNQFPDVERVSP